MRADVEDERWHVVDQDLRAIELGRKGAAVVGEIGAGPGPGGGREVGPEDGEPGSGGDGTRQEAGAVDHAGDHSPVRHFGEIDASNEAVEGAARVMRDGAVGSEQPGRGFGNAGDGQVRAAVGGDPSGNLPPAAAETGNPGGSAGGSKHSEESVVESRGSGRRDVD